MARRSGKTVSAMKHNALKKKFKKVMANHKEMQAELAAKTKDFKKKMKMAEKKLAKAAKRAKRRRK